MALDLNIVIGGAAGQGVHTITGLLARILVRQGCRVLSVQDYQSRIRGGHLFNRIRVSDQPLMSSREGIDLLVALNQETLTLHSGELSPDGVIIYDAAVVSGLPAGGERPGPHGRGPAPRAESRGSGHQCRGLRGAPGAAQGAAPTPDGHAAGGL